MALCALNWPNVISLFHPNFFRNLTTWKQRMRSVITGFTFDWYITVRRCGAEQAVGPGVMFFPHFLFLIPHEIWVRRCFFVGLTWGKMTKPLQVPWGSSILAGNCRLEGDSAHLCLIKTFFSKEQMSGTDAKTIFIVKDGHILGVSRSFRGHNIY